MQSQNITHQATSDRFPDELTVTNKSDENRQYENEGEDKKPDETIDHEFLEGVHRFLSFFSLHDPLRLVGLMGRGSILCCG